MAAVQDSHGEPCAVDSNGEPCRIHPASPLTCCIKAMTGSGAAV